MLMTMTNFRIENYKEIKNYIHNYLGLTKEEVRSIIDEVVKEIIKKEVSKYFNDKNGLESLIEKEIIRQLKCQDNVRKSFIINTMDGIYNKIDTIIHEEVLKRLKIELKEPNE